MNAENVNDDEVARFDELAGRWWDPDSELRTLHDINPVRLAWIQSQTPLQDSHGLDVGCGGGLLAEALAANGAKVTGIDLAASSIEVARLHSLESGVSVDYRLTGAERHAIANPGSYDLITCMELLEHVPDPQSIVTACAQMLKPGGSLYLSTLNRTWRSLAGAIIGAEYILNIVPRGTHDHGKFIKPSEMSRWCRGAGLQLSSLTGMHYNPATRTASLTRDVSINYIARFSRERNTGQNANQR